MLLPELGETFLCKFSGVHIQMERDALLPNAREIKRHRLWHCLCTCVLFSSSAIFAGVSLLSLGTLLLTAFQGRRLVATIFEMLILRLLRCCCSCDPLQHKWHQTVSPRLVPFLKIFLSWTSTCRILDLILMSCNCCHFTSSLGYTWL